MNAEINQLFTAFFFFAPTNLNNKVLCFFSTFSPPLLILILCVVSWKANWEMKESWCEPSWRCCFGNF